MAQPPRSALYARLFRGEGGQLHEGQALYCVLGGERVLGGAAAVGRARARVAVAIGGHLYMVSPIQFVKAVAAPFGGARALGCRSFAECIVTQEGVSLHELATRLAAPAGGAPAAAAPTAGAPPPTARIATPDAVEERAAAGTRSGDAGGSGARTLGVPLPRMSAAANPSAPAGERRAAGAGALALLALVKGPAAVRRALGTSAWAAVLNALSVQRVTAAAAAVAASAEAAVAAAVAATAAGLGAGPAASAGLLALCGPTPPSGRKRGRAELDEKEEAPDRAAQEAGGADPGARAGARTSRRAARRDYAALDRGGLDGEGDAGHRDGTGARRCSRATQRLQVPGRHGPCQACSSPVPGAGPACLWKLGPGGAVVCQACYVRWRARGMPPTVPPPQKRARTAAGPA